jgi:hypothetical protein
MTHYDSKHRALSEQQPALQSPADAMQPHTATIQLMPVAIKRHLQLDPYPWHPAWHQQLRLHVPCKVERCKVGAEFHKVPQPAQCHLACQAPGPLQVHAQAAQRCQVGLQASSSSSSTSSSTSS